MIKLIVYKAILLFLVLISLAIFPNYVFATEGDVLMVKNTESSSNRYAFKDVKVDSSGNIFVVGSVDGASTHNFGNGVSITSPTASGALIIVKYNSSGVAQWATTVSSATSGSGYTAIELDTDGNIVVAGRFGVGNYNLGNGVSFSVATAAQGVVAKYNSSGVAQWANTITSTGFNTDFLDVDTDSSNNVYVSGFLVGSGTYGFGNSVSLTTTTGSHNAVLVQYNSSGVTQWAKTNTTTNVKTSFKSVVVDSSNNIYVSGYIDGTSVDFGNSITVTGGVTGSDNILLIRYNTSGVAQWGVSTSSSNSISTYNAVTTDSSGNVYVAGFINGTNEYDFGNSVTATGVASGNNALVAKYSSLGVAQWAKTTTSGSIDSAYNAIAIDSNNYVYGSGEIQSLGALSFGDSISASGYVSNDYTILSVRYKSDGTPQWAKSLTSAPDWSDVYGNTVDSNGNLYIAARLGSASEYNIGNGFLVSGPATRSGIIVKYEAAVAPVVASDSNGSSNPTTQAGPSSCSVNEKVLQPDLFQVDVVGNTARIYFTPLTNTDVYYISYSTKLNAEEHGVLIPLGSVGVQSFQINHLNPHSKYYFKVRGNKGCLAGPWSTILSAKSRSKAGSVLYKYFKY